MIYEQLQIDGLKSLELTPQKSTLSRQGSRVNRTVLREKVEAIVMSVIYGEKLQECSERLNRAGSSVKIRRVYSQGRISVISSECSTTLPRWGIASGGEYGELATSEPRIEEIEYSLWVGTPTACASKRSAKFKKGRIPNPAEFAENFPTPMASQIGDCPSERKRHTPCLESYVMQFPTPTVYGNYNRKGATKTSGNGLATVVGGKLNPTWVEWLMGFPLGWTDLDASETQ